MSDSPPIQLQLRQIARSVNGLHRRLDGHDKAINGTNGQRGCRTRLALLEASTKQLATAQTRAFWFTLTYCVVGLITLVGSLLAAYWR